MTFYVNCSHAEVSVRSKRPFKPPYINRFSSYSTSPLYRVVAKCPEGCYDCYKEEDEHEEAIACS